MAEMEAGRATEIAGAIDIGKIIDESRLNRISVRVLVLCGLIMLMDGYDYGIMSVAAPVIMSEWNLTTASFGGVFSAAMFGYLFGAVIFGALSDRIGRKKALILGSFLFSLGTLLVYFSHSVESLIPIRVLTGAGIGGAVPCAITLTSEYAPSRGRGRYVSVMYSGFLFGIVCAGYIAGLMLRSAGWRPLFLLGFFAPLAVIILLALALPESARWLSAGRRAGTDRQTLLRVVRAMRPDIQVSLEASFYTRDSSPGRLPLKELFSGKLAWVTPVIWAYYLVSSVAVFFFGSWSPQLLVVKGFSAATAAFITGTNGILIAVGCLLSGFYFDRFGFRWGALLHIIAATGVLFMGGLAPLGFAMSLFATGFFINAAHMDVTILAPIVYPPNCRNQGAGAAIAVGRIGAMLGPYIGGILLAMEKPLEMLLALIAIPLALAAILCYTAGRQYDFYFAPVYSGQEVDR